MKKTLLIALFALSSLYTHAQEVITGGNMENEDNWSYYWRDGVEDNGYLAWNLTDLTPTFGEGGCLEVYGYGTAGIFIFQEVTLEPGAQYTFDGVIKNISVDALQNSWVELILSTTRPDDEEMGDWGAGAGDYIYAQNSWMDAPYNTMDTDDFFSSTYTFTWKEGADGEDIDLTGTNLIEIPDTAATTWYVCFKAGSWNEGAGDEMAYNFLIDEITLINQNGTGNNSISLNSSKVYPNPTNGQLTLFSEGMASYSIISSSGQLVRMGSFSQTINLQLEDIHAGIYFVQICGLNGRETHKITLK